jgi:hypothetical protein
MVAELITKFIASVVKPIARHVPVDREKPPLLLMVSEPLAPRLPNTIAALVEPTASAVLKRITASVFFMM